MRTSIFVAIAASLSLACKPRGNQTSSVKNDEAPSLASPQSDVAAAYLGEAIGRLAEVKRLYLSKAQNDPANPDVISIRVDENAKTLTVDLTQHAATLGQGSSVETLGRLLTFPLPNSAPSPDFGNVEFTRPFGNVLHTLLNAAAPGAGSVRFGGHKFESIFEQCNEQNFKEKASIFGNVPSGGDYEMGYDCRKMKRQAASGLTVTPIEIDALSMYAANFFANTNRLSRARRFAYGTADPSVAPDARRSSIEAFVSLAIISVLNKLDPSPEDTYRAIGAMRKSCEPKGAALPGAEPTTPEGAATRFCTYFQELKSYRECSFQSTSRLPDIALRFAKVLQTEEDNNDVEPTDAPLPRGGKVTVVFRIQGTSGQYIAPFSGMPFEEEVLYKPGIRFNVKAGSAAIALRPTGTSAPYTGYARYQEVPCSAVLTAEQKQRISHFRVTLTEGASN